MKEYATLLKGVSDNVANIDPPKMNTPQLRYGQLLLPLEEFIRLECVKRVENIYESLRMLYTNLISWDDDKDILLRRRLSTIVR